MTQTPYSHYADGVHMGKLEDCRVCSEILNPSGSDRSYGCGCFAGIVEIRHCPLHAAAPDMAALLRRVAEHPCYHIVCGEARALLAKIDGPSHES